MGTDDGKIQVRITDQSGGKNVTARLPASAQVGQLLPALVTKLQLPSNQAYYLSHKDSGKKLVNTDTLASAGVQEGHTLLLIPDVTAG